MPTDKPDGSAVIVMSVPLVPVDPVVGDTDSHDRSSLAANDASVLSEVETVTVSDAGSPEPAPGAHEATIPEAWFPGPDNVITYDLLVCAEASTPAASHISAPAGSCDSNATNGDVDAAH
ncbi:MAG: hypothetical protein GY722_15835 [bacterium]|nr:hypothetical protein [bacterium]